MPNPFNQTEHQEKKSMAMPPPKKKTTPPPPLHRDNRANGLRYQPNRYFENQAELDKYIEEQTEKGTRTVKVLEVWERKLLACRLEIVNKK